MALPDVLWDSRDAIPFTMWEWDGENESDQMPAVNKRAQTFEDSAASVETLRLEQERCQSELEVRRLRMGELEKGEALLAGENRLLKMVASGRSLADILSALCRLIEELSEGALCGVLLVDRASNRVGHVTGPSLPAEYNEAIRGVIIAAEAGPCGLAVCSKEQVITADVGSDTRWAGGWRALALSHGLRACWSTPISSSEGDVLGTFAIYWREPRSPSEQDQTIIGQTTHLAAVAIERHRTEEELRRSEAYLAEAQRLSRTGSFGWNVATGEIIWSRETYCILGYDRGVKPTLDLLLNRVPPEDRALVQHTIDRATRDGMDLDFGHRLVMADGVVKHVHVLAQPVKLGNGGLEFVGAIMDVTEQKKAQEALRASEHLARGQVEALTSTLAALAQESEPDRLLEHVLRTIVEQTRAHSIAAWNKNEDGPRFDLIAVIENGRFQTREEAVDPAGRLSMLPRHHPVWCEVIRTGQHGVMEVLDQESARMRVGSGHWHQVVEKMNPDPALTILMNHLRQMGVSSVLFVPLLIAGDVAGTLAVRFQEKRAFRREEIELTQALAHQAMLALELMRLSQQSRQAAVIAERNRMARDIHDTLAQGFTGVIMQLEAASGATTHGDLAEATNRIARASELARSSLGEARRSVRALRPHTLRNGKLFVALDGLLKGMAEGTNLNAEFHAEGDERSIPADFEEGLLRVTQEALTNAVKHASARNFSATLSVHANRILLRLVDDGRGFDPQEEHEGFGLIGMKERVDRMGGEFIVRAKPNVGTEILVELRNQPASKPEFENEQG